MFTGIIEASGLILAVREKADAREIKVRLPAVWRLKPGQSIAVDGGCLTVTKRGAGWAEFFIGPETLKKTVAGTYRKNSRVNLERAMQLGARLDGHLVLGHVDTTTQVLAVGPDGDAFRLSLALPAAGAGLVIPRGSLTVNGVSLTIAKLAARRLDIMLIPETWRRTNLSQLQPGNPVNLEYDLIGKYIRRGAGMTAPV